MTPLENLTRWNDYFENRRLYSNEERRMIRVQLRKEDEQEEDKDLSFHKETEGSNLPIWNEYFESWELYSPEEKVVIRRMLNEGKDNDQ